MLNVKSVDEKLVASSGPAESHLILQVTIVRTTGEFHFLSWYVMVFRLITVIDRLSVPALRR